MTVSCEISFPLPLPDDPRKWDGWTKYKSPNLYERLCLDPRANPSNEVIEEHCRELLRWWQKKLPLKNQPSNPLSQLLRPGLEESSRYLTEARVELLDPERRRAMDDSLAAQAHEEAMNEFRKFVDFTIADGILTAAEEKNLLQFGREQGLTNETLLECVEAQLAESGAKREVPPQQPSPSRRRRGSLNPKDDFLRMLRLSGLDSDAMTDDQRDAFINMAENLGIDAGEAEDLVDVYLDEADELSNPEPIAPEPPKVEVVANQEPAPPETQIAEPAPAPAVEPELKVPSEAEERAQFINFENSLRGAMIFVPSGQFVMGSDAIDAAPNERPPTRVTVTRY